VGTPVVVAAQPEDGAVLVPGDDEQAVVAPCPRRVAAEMLLYPAIAGVPRAVMHVVAQVRYDRGDSVQVKRVIPQPKGIKWREPGVQVRNAKAAAGAATISP